MPKLKISEIVIGEDRIRKDISKLEELVASIRKYGLLHPIVIDKETKTLIAGERRLRSHMVLAESDPKFSEIEVKYMSDLDSFQLKEIELEENLAREQLSWHEEVAARKELHELKQSMYGQSVSGREGGWRLEDTADALGLDKSTLSQDISLAQGIEQFPELKRIPSKKKALEVLKTARERAILRELAARRTVDGEDGESENGKGEITASAVGALLSSVLGEDVTIGFVDSNPKASYVSGEYDDDEDGDRDDFDDEDEDDEYTVSVPKMQVAYSSDGKAITIPQAGVSAVNNNCLEVVASLPNDSIDLAIVDPPFGLGDKMVGFGGKEVNFDNDPSHCLYLYANLLPELFRVMKPGTHCYLFIAIQFLQTISRMCEEAAGVDKSTGEYDGFIVRPMPLIWVKESSHRADPDWKIPTRYEAAIWMYKEPARPLNRFMDDVFIIKREHTTKRIHPMERPYSLMKEWVEVSSNPGDQILDPFGGSFVVPHVCLDTGRKCLSVELNEDNFGRGILRMEQAVEDLYERDVKALNESQKAIRGPSTRNDGADEDEISDEELESQVEDELGDFLERLNANQV